jgi:hypothetical protein
MCAWAFNAILPFITTIRFDGRFPWREEPLARVCCPDAENPVVFQLTPELKSGGKKKTVAIQPDEFSGEKACSFAESKPR